jgi:hypothetical protein
LKTIHEEGEHHKEVNFQAGFSCSSQILWLLQRNEKLTSIVEGLGLRSIDIRWVNRAISS